MLGPDPRGQQPDVVDQAGPAAGAEVSQRRRISAGAVTAVVLRVDHEAGLVQRPGHVLVAPRVLAHAVRQLDRSAR